MACPPEDFRALGLERRQAQFTFDLFENPLGRDRLSIASATFDALPIGVHDAGSRSDIEVRSEEHTSELQSLMRISYAVFCLKKKNTTITMYNKYNKPRQHKRI